jgi:protease PrsW
MAALIYWLDRYEKEPIKLLGAAFFWGAVLAAGGAFLVNTLIGVGIYLMTGSGTVADLTTASLIAPFVEEALKGSAVLLVFLVFRSEFDSILDGIIYAAITALGFAASENVLYIYQHGYLQDGWPGLWQMVLIRDVVVAWQHPFFTAFTGIGLAAARLSKTAVVKLIAPIAGYLAAVLTHSFHNTFTDFVGGLEGFTLGSLIDWFGWSTMLLFIVYLILRERGLLKRQLKEEVASGLISPTQYSRALSPLTMSTAYLSGGRSAAQFYRMCGELAHKKEQLLKFGDEQGNAATIETLRSELAALGTRVG